MQACKVVTCKPDCCLDCADRTEVEVVRTTRESIVIIIIVWPDGGRGEEDLFMRASRDFFSLSLRVVFLVAFI